MSEYVFVEATIPFKVQVQALTIRLGKRDLVLSKYIISKWN